MIDYVIFGVGVASAGIMLRKISEVIDVLKEQHKLQKYIVCESRLKEAKDDPRKICYRCVEMGDPECKEIIRE